MYAIRSYYEIIFRKFRGREEEERLLEDDVHHFLAGKVVADGGQLGAGLDEAAGKARLEGFNRAGEGGPNRLLVSYNFV